MKHAASAVSALCCTLLCGTLFCGMLICCSLLCDVLRTSSCELPAGMSYTCGGSDAPGSITLPDKAGSHTASVCSGGDGGGRSAVRIEAGTGDDSARIGGDESGRCDAFPAKPACNSRACDGRNGRGCTVTAFLLLLASFDESLSQ